MDAESVKVMRYGERRLRVIWELIVLTFQTWHFLLSHAIELRVIVPKLVWIFNTFSIKLSNDSKLVQGCDRALKLLPSRFNHWNETFPFLLDSIMITVKGSFGRFEVFVLLVKDRNVS